MNMSIQIKVKPQKTKDRTNTERSQRKFKNKNKNLTYRETRIITITGNVSSETTQEEKGVKYIRNENNTLKHICIIPKKSYKPPDEKNRLLIK